MRVRYTPRAQNNLEAIYIYLEQRSPAGARSVKDAIERRIRQLADIPYIAPVTEEPGLYELSVTRYPYKIYYRVEGDEVRVVHIRHSSRRPPEVSEL
jgi:toxin ParE1/3/4